MAKLQIKSKTIATFGGVFPIMDVFEHIGLSASTVKTYFEDEDGDKWLIPGNPNFTPIQLKPEDDNRMTS